MSIIERVEDPGRFTIPLDPDLTPEAVLSTVVRYGHIVILPNRPLDVELHADADILASARYAGPVLEKNRDQKSGVYYIRGQGMARHLGDAIGNGPILFQNITYTAETIDNIFAQVSAGGILPPAVTAGTITTTGVGTYTGGFEEADRPIDAIRKVAADLNLSWRVNPAGTIDVCLASRDEVFRTTSAAIKYAVVPRGFGVGGSLRSVEIDRLESSIDATNYATRIVQVGEQFDGSRQVLDFQDRATIAEKDIHGNELVWNAIMPGPVVDVSTDRSTWFARQLADWSEDQELTVDALEEELASGQAMVGDSYFCWVPPVVRDETNGIWHRGRLYPFQIIQAKEAEWFLRRGMAVLYRAGDAVYTDLTKYVRWER